jgi:hypothetical protein
VHSDEGYPYFSYPNSLCPYVPRNRNAAPAVEVIDALGMLFVEASLDKLQQDIIQPSMLEVVTGHLPMPL